MGAVVALSAAMLLLAFSALNTHVELPDSRPASSEPVDSHWASGESADSHWASGELPDSVSLSASERLLRGVLASQRSAALDTVFRRHRSLAEQFVGAAASHLRRISPLFAGASVEHSGGAYEETRVSNAADFDMYTALASAPLLQFEVLRAADGSFAMRLLPGAAPADLPEDLQEMLTEDGYLDARRFKQWTVECTMWALLEAAEARPELRPQVYTTPGAPGVTLTAADGATVEIDFTVKLSVPPTRERLFRPAALRPCGLSAVPPGDRPSSHLYSGAVMSNASDPADGTDAAARRRFTVDEPSLMQSLMRQAPQLRHVTRLLKTLGEIGDWYHRFGVQTFPLKQASLWAWADGCEQAGAAQARLLPATVAALRRLEDALRRGRLDNFWFAAPALNVLDTAKLQKLQLADELAGCVETLTSGDQHRIRRLFGFFGYV